MKKVAILIPCFNGANFLPELFENINRQTVPFDEIICYDDCSTDDTIEIALRLGAQVIKGKSNKGAAFARNRLIEATTCEYIHFHDADDLIDVHFVEKMHAIIDRESYSKSCVISDMRVLERESRKKESVVSYKQLEIDPDPVKFFLSNNGYAIVGCYPKSLLEKIGGFREDLRGNEDPDFHVRLALNGATFICTGEPLVTNLVRNDSFSSSNWMRCMKDRFKCLESYAKLIQPKHYANVGKQAAELSIYFYNEGEKAYSKKARELALSLGINRLDSTRFSRKCSKLLGLSSCLWIYRRKRDFKWIINPLFR